MNSASVRTALLKKVKRVVVKVGSSVLTDAGALVNFNAFASLVDQIAGMRAKGYEVVVVSSGAIAIGIGKLGLKQRPQSIPLKQAVAAVGQTGLMEIYDRFFKEKNLRVGQVLLTRLILKDRALFLNARNTLLTLLKLGIIPVINENDSVVVDEIKLGDNDNLAVITTTLVDADLLIILTDQDGLFEADPKKHEGVRLISLVTKIDKGIEGVAGTSKSSHGVGGMVTKLTAAKKTTKSGIPVIVANGRTPGTLDALMRGEEKGTLFLPQASRLPSRKSWIAYALKPKGALIIDEGAQEAIVKNGKSLLAIGVMAVEGEFQFGDPVRVRNRRKQEIGRGLVNYSASELGRIKGIPTKEIERVLGYKFYDEVIHRDDLVVF